MRSERGRIMARVHGFTLIELMVVVAIMAILAAVAIPAYSRYGYRARRADGQEVLLRIANAQERYYATYNRYGALTDMGYADPALSEKGFYAVSLTTQTASAYTATAVPLGVQQNDACGPLQLDSTGFKAPAVGDAATHSNGSCW